MTQLTTTNQTPIIFGDDVKGQVLTITEQLNTLPIIKDVETCNQADIILKTATKMVKDISTIRLTITKPLDDRKSEIMDAEKMMVNPLKNAIEKISSNVLLFKKEMERQAEAKRKELERQAEERQKLIDEQLKKKEDQRNLVLQFKEKGIIAINNSTLANIDGINITLSSYQITPELFGESVPDAMNVKLELHGLIEKRKQLLIEAENNNEAKLKLETEAAAAQENLNKEKETAAIQTTTDQMNASFDNELNKGAAMAGIQTASGVKKVWVVEVINAAAIPKDYLCIDEAKIKAAIRDGEREIPGLRIYQDIQRTGR